VAIYKSTGMVSSFPEAKDEAARERAAHALWCTSKKNMQKTHWKNSIKIYKNLGFSCSKVQISPGRLTPLCFLALKRENTWQNILLQNYRKS